MKGTAVGKFKTIDLYSLRFAGNWYQVPEAALITFAGRPFSPHKAAAGGTRPCVLLTDEPVVNIPVWARSTSERRDGITHQPHDHAHDYRGCTLDKPGRVVNTVRISIRESELGERRCSEPDGHVRDAIERQPRSR